MAKLIYSALTSLDGYIEDASGSFDWAAPSDEVHAFINDLERSAGTHLYGRRMYETMIVWETLDTGPDQTPEMRDFANMWRSVDKIVYSRTLQNVSTSRTRLERTFEPEAVRRLKTEAERDLLVGGPELAAHVIRAGLVDEYHLFFSPIVVGGGKRSLPEGSRLSLELMDERRFGDGTVFLRYQIRS
jgi:dihydrofolate reductase